MTIFGLPWFEFSLIIAASVLLTVVFGSILTYILLKLEGWL